MSKESYDNEVFMTAYKTLIKTLVSNLSPVKDFSDADLEGMLDLERTLVRVCPKKEKSNIKTNLI